jgi:hypothetical protein
VVGWRKAMCSLCVGWRKAMCSLSEAHVCNVSKALKTLLYPV